ncbi:MAG: hypothetical protein SPL55_08135 [Prevotella sp.]|nr:hypothetical protein [Prevotella sp.]
MNKRQTLAYIAQVYMNSYSNIGMVQIFNHLQIEYNNYLKTGETDTLRYILALCIRRRHGYRMPWKSTKLAVDKLVTIKIFQQQFSDFEHLHQTIQQAFKGIKFAQGKLMVYDTACNIGQLLQPKIEPASYVYLPAGAFDGAKLLLNGSNVQGIMPTSVWQTSNLFPGLDSKCIEDVLCIFKKPIFEKLSQGLPVTEAEVDNHLKTNKITFHSKKYVLSRI